MTTTSSAVSTDHGHDQHHRTFAVLVNTHKVELGEKKMTGSQIKTAAIAQGAELEQDFQLSLKHQHGHGHGNRYDIIGDDDKVKIEDGLEFVAVAGDDNS